MVFQILLCLTLFGFSFSVGEGNKRFKTLPSSIKDYDLGNLHQITPLLFRAASPEQNIHEIQRLGIQKILIIKKQKHDEVDQEIIRLKKAGYQQNDILNIPLPWRGIEDFSEQCENIMKALIFLKKQKLKTLIHCTVGEDRTGLVAGLYRQKIQNIPSKQVFKDEMCAHGYAHANRSKPMWVADAVHENLTPLFIYISNLKTLDPKACQNINISELRKSPMMSVYKCDRGIIQPEK